MIHFNNGLSDSNGEGIVEINKYKHLESMDTSKLYALLQQESSLSEDENFDVELVQIITEILETRELSFADIDVYTSLEKFKAEIVPEIERENADMSKAVAAVTDNASQKRMRIKKRIGLAFTAAIIMTLLISSVIAQAFWNELWKAAISWGKETFRISANIEPTSPLDDYSTSEESDGIAAISTKIYLSIDEAINDFDIPIAKPQWIPVDFRLSRVEVSLIEQRKSLLAFYQADEKVLMFNAIMYNSTDATASYEINEGNVDSLIINGIKHHLMTNLEQTRIVWVNGNLVYSLNGNIPKEDLIKVLHSMYEGEK